MRAGRKWRRVFALPLALGTFVIAAADVSAHRRDEYLQAARLAVEPGRAELELALTPGIAVADAIIADIDRDRDGMFSAHEKQAYVATVLDAIELQIDGRAAILTRRSISAMTYSYRSATNGSTRAARRAGR